MAIGIGITTHNRYDVFSKTFTEINKFLPDWSKLVVVDDASNEPVKEATYRFQENVGIARAKNKCLELLEGCEHVFIFDDDTYPKSVDWWKPYVDNVEPHLMYIFKDFASGRKLGDSVEVFRDDKIRAYTHPRGCMLYLERKAIDAVGGMDVSYRRWGYEHVDYSNRIYNAGLTSFRYADIVNSGDLIYSGDEHEAVRSTVEHDERRVYLKEMRSKFDKSFSSREYCEYKNESKSGQDAIIAAYFTRHVDPQRNTKWQPDIKDLEDLIASCKDERLVILYDEIIPVEYEHVEWVKVDTVKNPYFQRWLEYYRYLRSHPNIVKAFLVDSTDVKLLNSPFESMNEETLYVGDEPYSSQGQPTNLANRWLVSNVNSAVVRNYFKANRGKTLLNCGVVGGGRLLLLDFCHRMIQNMFVPNCKLGPFDMPIFNYLCYTEYEDKVEYGREVTTIFKKYEETSEAWFKHK